MHQEYKIWQQINNARIYFHPVDKKQIDLFDRLETGRITSGVFRQEIRLHAANKLTDSQIDSAWNAPCLREKYALRAKEGRRI